ncbi:hypothetical protein ACXZ65_31135 [Streptomyces aculeolatus]
MAVIALVSVKGSGATVASLAMALSSPRPTLLAECDPAGGTVRAGYLQAHLDASVGLHQLAAADRQGPDALATAFEAQLRPLDASGNRLLLAGLTDPRQASALSGTWPQLAQLLELMDTRAGYDVLVDAGRLTFDAGGLHPQLTPAALLHAADVVLLVVQGHAASLAAGHSVLPVLRDDLEAHGSGADALGLLLVGRGPYGAAQVAQNLGLPVLALLPWDVRVAEFLAVGGPVPRGLGRSELVRAARSAAGPIEEAVQRRRIHRAFPPAHQPSPQVAGVLERIAQARAGAGV